ncbi:hypothetical protein QQF45_08215 [Halopseudomonas aestusnigri]|jgi:hypothetical protein|uniref:hypothetical protein n=1 Tax=Halopseudomonas TaxID=2901189 RepID=UPI001D180261|nr:MULTISPECIES: hypothetical protein [Halopseudomonas]MEE2798630.1 hypothetical protein [Pseudomonadota bacterium]MCC4259099.1 hypothetical protein [Halopseudomonas aestusnigri]MDL2199056.1 hypothetical protein [Halopseudomonas aestusnigri]UGV32800.1 hypothetical protein LO767_07650 [Halopseudomonas aestusnigri]BDX19932.1 hypothetical protein MFKK_27420 [Halopseudomonas aestusnigri]|tara:strand:- start:14058 stop:14252 length:195 start_codon:yes stop_codon:yes gene_type:complete
MHQSSGPAGKNDDMISVWLRTSAVTALWNRYLQASLAGSIDGADIVLPGFIVYGTDQGQRRRIV